MIPIRFFRLFILFIMVVVNANCKKDSTLSTTSNTSPKVNAGSDIQVILPTNSCILVGSALDEENNIDVIIWKKILGPASFNIDIPGQLSTSVINLESGVYQFELTVTDAVGLSDRDTVIVNVNSSTNVNHPPVANAGTDQTIQLPLNSMILDGSGSADVDNNITSYQWTKIAGPSSYAIAASTAVQTSVTNLVVGTYKFELQVSDAGGLLAKDTMQVIVNPVGTGNQPPVANAGPDKSINLPIDNIMLDGSGSSDLDNNIITFQWTKIAGPSTYTIVASTAVQTSVINLVVGTYKFELKVTDNGGLSDKDTIQVIVGPVVTNNQPPIANAGPDKGINLPVNYTTLNGSNSIDPNFNISSFQWTKIAGPSSFAIVSPTAVQTTVSNLVEGYYEFELKVTDTEGLWSKDTVKITVYGNTHEIIFENQIWISPWYNAIEIPNFFSIVPNTSPFRIFIKRDAAPVWIEVDPIANNGSGGPYEYFIETRTDGGGIYTYGNLYIFFYGADISDTPDVKIIF